MESVTGNDGFLGALGDFGRGILNSANDYIDNLVETENESVTANNGSASPSQHSGQRPAVSPSGAPLSVGGFIDSYGKHILIGLLVLLALGLLVWWLF